MKISKKTIPVVGALAIILLAGGFLSNFYLRQRQASKGLYDRSRIYPWQQPAESAKIRQQAIARAKELRAKWRVWALEHKEELKHLLESSSTDETAKVVYNQIPARPDVQNCGLTLDDLRIGEPQFTWQALQKGGVLKATDSRSVGQYNRSQEMAKRLFQKNFSERHDIQLSVSMGHGPLISLWASGRITEGTLIQNPDSGSGKPAFIRQTTEVEPAYDFLK